MASEESHDVSDEQVVAQLVQIVNAFRHYTVEYRDTLLKSGAHEVMSKYLKVNAFRCIDSYRYAQCQKHWMTETMTPATTELCRWLRVSTVDEMEVALEKRSDGLSY